MTGNGRDPETVMIKVKFFTTLQIHLGLDELQCAQAADIDELLHECERRTKKPFLSKLLDEHGALIPGTIILVNGHNIHHLEGLETAVSDGDHIALFPPGGGG